MCMCRRVAVRPKCPENSLLNLGTVSEGLSHGHVAQESQPPAKLSSSQAVISCPWEVRVSLFSPCPSQIQLPAAGLVSQAALFLSPPARLLDESSGNCKGGGPELRCLGLPLSRTGEPGVFMEGGSGPLASCPPNHQGESTAPGGRDPVAPLEELQLGVSQVRQRQAT